MKKGQYTYNQVVNLYGEDFIDRLYLQDCSPTNRVGYNGQCQGNDYCEWASTLKHPNGDIVVAYYYIDNASEVLIADAGDLSVILWIVYGYDIV
jgi:hypothetical protein